MRAKKAKDYKTINNKSKRISKRMSILKNDTEISGIELWTFWDFQFDACH
jgi:hypothetical protein